MIVYKGTNKDLQCKGHQYIMGVNSYDGLAIIRDCGFHSQDKIQDVFKWYPAYHDNRYFECDIPDDSYGDDGLYVSEQIVFLRELSKDEIISLITAQNLDYNVVEACYPVNPLEICNEVTQADIDNLMEWRSISDGEWDGIRQSVRGCATDSVWDSVWNGIWDGIRKSIRKSVRDIVYAYIGSLFPNIQKWKHIDHELGVYPFQSGADLWRRGFVPVRENGAWCLWSQGKIVYRSEQ